MQFDVTIGIPTYNRAKYLERAIDSALRQNHVNVEIIVCDNASNDQTSELVKKYDHNKNFRYVRNSLNIGPIANYNQCLNLASGKNFFILGDDDWISDNYCYELTQSITGDHSLFLGRCDAVDINNKLIHQSFTEPFALSGVEYLRLLLENHSKTKRHANFMIAAPTQLLREVGGFPSTQAAQHSDNMLLMKLLTSNSITYNPNVSLNYQVYAESYGNQKVEEIAIASIQFLSFWDHEIQPNLKNSLPPHQIYLLRMRLIIAITIIYLQRIHKYGGTLSKKIYLLRQIPRLRWLLLTSLSPRTYIGIHHYLRTKICKK